MPQSGIVIPASGSARYGWSWISLTLPSYAFDAYNITSVFLIPIIIGRYFISNLQKGNFFQKMSSPKISRSKFSKEGSVVRVTMKNFMIYHHETIWPGKSTFRQSKYVIIGYIGCRRPICCVLDPDSDSIRSVDLNPDLGSGPRIQEGN
jgi:hypothetical protein